MMEGWMTNQKIAYSLTTGKSFLNLDSISQNISFLFITTVIFENSTAFCVISDFFRRNSTLVSELWMFLFFCRCECDKCRIMPTARECLCCKEVPQVLEVMQEFPEISCITDHSGFQSVCLDLYVLRTAYFSYRQHYKEEMGESPE